MELRLALRGIRRYPAVFGSVALSIGLSVSICTSLFSILDGILFRPLPLADEGRLVVVDYAPVQGRQPPQAMLPGFADIREELRSRITSLRFVEAYADTLLSVYFDAYDRQRNGLRVQAIDSRFLPLLGLRPEIGSQFTTEDERRSSALSQPSAEPLPVIIGHTLARDLFGGAPALGIHDLAGRRVRVVGVMPLGVKYPGDTNVWVATPPRRDRVPSHVKLALDVSPSQLQAALPELRVRTIRETAYPEQSTAVILLFGSAFLLLALTWVQVSGVVFLWASGQSATTSIRLALGAKRTHFLRQFIIQGGLVALAALSTAALAIRPLTEVMIRNLPAELSHGQYLQPDRRAFVFLVALSFVGFALLSYAALKAAVRTSSADALRAHTNSGLAHDRKVRRRLLVAQFTLTSVLLYLTGLVAHSFANAITMDYGFDAPRVLVFTPPRPTVTHLGASERLVAIDAFKRVINTSTDRVHGLPGVTAAASAFSGPLGIANQQPPTRVESIDGRSVDKLEAASNSVGTHFLPAMGAQILQGRSFDDPEFRARSDVALVNETLARRLAENLVIGGVQMPVIGRRIATNNGQLEIIGVIKDFIGSRIGVASPPQFFSHDPKSLAAAVIFIRTDQTAATFDAVRKSLESVWGTLPDRHFVNIADELRPLLAPYKSQAILLGFVAICGLPIAAVGLVAAISHSVRTRRSEISIHVAIGAGPREIKALVIREALNATIVGVALGSTLGAGLGSIVSTLLFGVLPVDIFTVFAVATVLVGLCGLAAWIPIRAASRLDPAAILRS